MMTSRPETPVFKTVGLSRAQEEEREAMLLRRDPQFYRAVREMLLRRRDQRREQTEASSGETAHVMRGRCQELTSILNDIFPPIREET